MTNCVFVEFVGLVITNTRVRYRLAAYQKYLAVGLFDVLTARRRTVKEEQVDD